MKKLTKRAKMSELRKYEIDSASCILEIQLVDIDFYPRMSEETLAFNAILQIFDGSQICKFDCSNDGKGGSTCIHPHYYEAQPERAEYSKTILQKWDSYLSTQRDEKFYKVAEQYGWNLSDMKEATKSAESEINDMLAVWCDSHNL